MSMEIFFLSTAMGFRVGYRRVVVPVLFSLSKKQYSFSRLLNILSQRMSL